MDIQIDAAIALFKKGPINDEIALNAPFHSLSISLLSSCDDRIKPIFQGIQNIEKSISDDIWNISVVIHRIDLLNKCISQKMYSELWHLYLPVDIDMFHIQVRSILDNIAKMIDLTAKKKNQIPNTFDSLFNKIDKQVNLLEPDIINLVKKNNWYEPVRKVRDDLVHNDGRTIVFKEESDRILFQVYSNSMKRIIKDSRVMVDENMANFKSYVAIILANLFGLLNDLTMLLLKKYNAKLTQGCFLMLPGYKVMLEWFQEFKDSNLKA